MREETVWKQRQAWSAIHARIPTLRRLEWLGILAPLVFLALYHYLMVGPAHGLLHSLRGLILLIALVGLGIAAFSRLMFRFISRLQEDVEALSQVASSQNAQLRALNEANLALSQERLVSSVLQRVVDLSRELSRARYAALIVVSDEGNITAFLTSGISQSSRQAIGSLPTGNGLLGLVLRRTEPLRLDNITDHPASAGFPPGHPPMITFLGVPIRYKGQTVGSLYMTEKIPGGTFTVEDEEIVSLFANQAAVAIQNARLYEQIQALAVEAERSRISREMHDGLAQVLSYVNTKAQAVETYLGTGDISKARDQVKELSQDARKVYQDIREGIVALRSQVGSDRNLRDVLEEYVSEYERQIRRPVKIHWQFRPQDMVLSPLQEVQVLRIIQEALSNVRKHAEATEIFVNFADRQGDLEIEVKDNGRGFNPLAIRRGEWPHLGIQTMQERAEAIGGHLDIDSAPDKGTTVRVRLVKAVHPRVVSGAS